MDAVPHGQSTIITTKVDSEEVPMFLQEIEDKNNHA